MPEHSKIDTREKIQKVAAELFSESGYDKVTTREIAKVVGINPASIYYHFPSKEHILKSLYDFYSEQRRKESPDLGELLKLAETAPPHEVLMKSEFHYDEKIRGYLDHILITASRRICADADSEEFIRENIFGPVTNILKPLLNRMIELGKIKPFDVDVFIRILHYYFFSAAVLNNTPFQQDVADFLKAMSHIYSLIVPVDKEAM